MSTHGKVHGFDENFCKVEVPTMEQVLAKIYPVGAIYMSVSPTSPASLFGGTWTQWGSGRVPIGINSSDNDFNTVEKTGGSKTAPLRAMIGAVNSNNKTIGYQAMGPVTGVPNYNQFVNVGADGEGGSGGVIATHTTRVTDTAGKDPELLQPYITCYMWKRVS